MKSSKYVDYLIHSYRHNISWESLKKISKNRFLKSSSLTVLLIPIIAKINTYEHNTEESFLGNLLSSLDFSNISIPENFIKLYWAGIIYIFATVMHQITCPSIIYKYSDYADFASRDIHALREYNEHRKRKGFSDEGNLSLKVHKQYAAKMLSAADKFPFVRTIILLLYCTSLYITSLVLIRQILSVWKITQFHNLFFLS